MKSCFRGPKWIKPFNYSIWYRSRVNLALIHRQNGDGFIVREELTGVLGDIELDDQAWNEIIRDFDTNRDGKV
jgi:hypothetical protein